MRVFIAGGSGAIGRFLVPQLVGVGHEVVALTRSPQRAEALERMGAAAVLGDAYDEGALTRWISAARADLVMHQLTAFGTTDGDPYAETIRIRVEGTRLLVGAARAAGVRRFITQSISFMCSPAGTGLTDEDAPLYLDGPAGAGALANAIASLEQQTLDAYPTSGIVLRYGWFFGPGTSYDPNDMIPNGLRAGTLPIAGEGAGNYSFIDLRDAAAATVKAVARETSGTFNIVDDAPIRSRDFLPVIARLVGAPEPQQIPEAVACDRSSETCACTTGTSSGRRRTRRPSASSIGNRGSRSGRRASRSCTRHHRRVVHDETAAELVVMVASEEFGAYLCDELRPLGMISLARRSTPPSGARRAPFDEHDELTAWSRSGLAAAQRVASKRGRAKPKRA